MLHSDGMAWQNASKKKKRQRMRNWCEMRQLFECVYSFSFYTQHDSRVL